MEPRASVWKNETDKDTLRTTTRINFKGINGEDIGS